MKKPKGELGRNAESYTDAKKALKESLAKSDLQISKVNEPETAIELIGQRIQPHQPVKQAFIAEHIFRVSIEDAIPCGIIGMDLSQTQIYVNRFFCNMVGWGKKELVGEKYPFSYWPQHLINRKPGEYNCLLNGDFPDEGLELLFERKNGEPFWGLAHGALLLNSNGEKIGYLFSISDITQRKNAEKALKEVSGRLIDTQEKERQKISQELHDSIGAKLTSIKYGLEKIHSDQDDTAKQLHAPIKDLIHVTRQTIDETHRILKSLRPSVLDDLGLKAALRDLIRDYISIYSHLDIKVKLQIDEKDVPEKIKILVYRVVQEALNNIAKHSGATCVWLSLERSEKHVLLEISDDGCGFDIRKKELSGMGLATIQERVALFGGSLQVNTSIGKGTLIQAGWPCG